MPSSTSASRTLALGLGLALFAGSEWALWTSRTWARFLLRHEPSAASADTFGVASRIRLTESGAAPLLALLGSSVSREGLDCALLLRRFAPGGACVNLGIGGGAPLDMLHISRELGPAPRTVVIAIFPGILSKAPKSGFIDSLTIRAVAESGAWSDATPDEWRRMGSGLLQALSPTLRHREGLRDAFRERAQRRPARSDPLSGARRTSDDDRKPPEYFANRVGRLDPDLGLSRFTAAQELALDWLMAREIRAGHRTVVVDFPVRPGFETTLPADVRARYATLLARLKSRSDILFVEAAALGPLAEGDFIDFTHVDSNGRRLLSERLGALIEPQ